VNRGPVLILGAVSDIGRAIAAAYAKAGRPLVLVARRPERLARDAEDLRLRFGADITVMALDVTDLAGHVPLIEALNPFPDTVVSVVGLLGDQRAPIARESAALIMQTNYVAPSLFLEEIANRMKVRGRGAIIGISSVAGDRGRASNYVYGSAKAGFTAFLSGLRNRLAPFKIDVVTVKPGFVNTRMTQGMALPRALTAQPDEIAHAVLRAEERRQDVIYVRRSWRFIMAVINLIPEKIFKHMKL
jgi:decaprenylphospho-beta-D-erythro-pentofuranosid-2-ulose 2-reductase